MTTDTTPLERYRALLRRLAEGGPIYAALLDILPTPLTAWRAQEVSYLGYARRQLFPGHHYAETHHGDGRIDIRTTVPISFAPCPRHSVRGLAGVGVYLEMTGGEPVFWSPSPLAVGPNFGWTIITIHAGGLRISTLTKTEEGAHE